MERREALEIIKNLTDEENLDPQTAQTMINDYHKPKAVDKPLLQ